MPWSIGIVECWSTGFVEIDLFLKEWDKTENKNRPLSANTPILHHSSTHHSITP
jgi:hypothetical protein